MTENDYLKVLEKIVNRLKDSSIAWVVTGSLGMAEWAWGEPRATQDLDIVIKLPVKAAGRFSRELEKRNMLVPVDIILDAMVEDRAVGLKDVDLKR